MPTKRLLELRASVRIRGEFDDSYFPDAQINAWINESIADLWDLIIEVDDARSLEQSDIDVVSGTRDYDLPDDFYIFMGADIVDDTSGSGYRTLARYVWGERNDGLASTNKWETRYEVRGGKIRFHPTPNWNDTVRLSYIKTAPILTSDYDNFDTINAWTEYVILDVLIKCAAKEDVDSKTWEKAKANQERRIRRIGTIDRGEPKRILNIYRSRKSFHRRKRYVPWSR